jgi:hypothetical protein
VALAGRLRKLLLLASVLGCTAVQAQQPPPHPHTGKTAYYCDRSGSIAWQVEPCGAGQQQLRTGRVRDNGTIEEDNPPPAIDVRPQAERAPAAAPVQAAPAQSARAQAAPSPKTETHRFGYIKHPWAWLLGFALVFGLAGKMLGRSFTRWAVVGALTEFILVGLDLMPLK